MIKTVQQFRSLLTAATLCLWETGTSRAGEDGLMLMFNDIEPYIIVKNGHPEGFLADYLQNVFDAASVKLIWQSVLWEKQFPTIRRNPPNVCITGVYKTPDREKIARYSAPIGQDEGYVLVGRINDTRLQRHTTFSAVAQDPDLHLLMQKDAVHSDYINKHLKKRDFPRTVYGNRRLVRAVLAGTNDYMIMPRFMAPGLLKMYGMIGKLSIYSHYTDLDDGGLYYLACSKATSITTLDRVNAAIRQAGLAIPPRQSSP